MEPFNAEKARAGCRVVTASGKPCEVVCWNRLHPTHTLLVLFNRDCDPYVLAYTLCGKSDTGEDLALDPREEEKDKYIVLRGLHGRIYPVWRTFSTIEEAEKCNDIADILEYKDCQWRSCRGSSASE